MAPLSAWSRSGDLCLPVCLWVSPGERFHPKMQKQPSCPQTVHPRPLAHSPGFSSFCCFWGIEVWPPCLLPCPEAPPQGTGWTILPSPFLIPSTPQFSPRLYLEEGDGNSWVEEEDTRVDGPGRRRASPSCCVALSPCWRAGGPGLPGPRFSPLVLRAVEWGKKKREGCMRFL